MVAYQEVAGITWPNEASMSAQQSSSRKIWEQITIRPSWKQLCHRFRKQKGLKEGFLKAWSALNESISSHSRFLLFWEEYSIAKIKPISSASKTKTPPRLLAKHPKNVPLKSRKIPPQEALKSIMKPFVLAFTQIMVGAFRTTEMTS